MMTVTAASLFLRSLPNASFCELEAAGRFGLTTRLPGWEGFIMCASKKKKKAREALIAPRGDEETNTQVFFQQQLLKVSLKQQKS